MTIKLDGRRTRVTGESSGIGEAVARRLAAAAAAATVTVNDTETRDPGIGCWFADLPSKKLPAGVILVFTVRWPEGWAGQDFPVAIAKPQPTRKKS